MFIIFFLLLRYVKLFQIDGIPNSYLPISYLVKVLSGLIFLLIYTYHYGGGNLSADAGQFLNESKVLNDVFYESPIDYFRFLFGFNVSEIEVHHYLENTSHWDAGSQTILNDNRNLLRFHSLIHFFSFNNAYIHIITTCFITVFSIKNFYLGLQNYVSLNKKKLFWILVLFPSVLFWSSSVLKEPLMILGLSFIFRVLLEKSSFRTKIKFGLIGIIFLVGFKPYVFIILIISLITYFLYTLISLKNRILKVIIVLLFASILPLIFNKTTLKITQYLSRKQYDFVNISKGGIHVDTGEVFYFFKPEQYNSIKIEGDSVQVIKDVQAEILQHGSIEQPQPIFLKASTQKWKIHFMNTYNTGYIEITPIENSPIQLIKNIPEALLNSLFRPYINDKGSWLKFPAVIETWILFTFLILAIIKRKALSKKEKNIIFTLSIFVILLSLLIGWTTPVLGAIVRYRIPAYLGILFIALILYSPNSSSE